MNITTGGPHVLLFERDQQLVALLTSELQLAGYECHTARTAVEVFDAIARYPVRLLLVNLAQAAAARREFWVALDTQRRGRGVQVLTFHCSNLGSYGPSSDDIDEQTNTMLADMEVDGMLGIMNMVNTIRSRIAISNTGAISRLSANANSSSTIGGQATLPIPTVTQVNNSPASMNTAYAGTTPSVPAQPSPASATSAAQTNFSRATAPGHTDKIRAVIYPSQRTWSTIRENVAVDSQTNQTREQQQGFAATPAFSSVPPEGTTFYRPSQNHTARSASEANYSNESSLAQLSRMIQEQHSPLREEVAQQQSLEQGSPSLEETALQQRVRPEDLPPISTMTLRASPIQDMPTDRAAGSSGQSDMTSHTNNRRYDEFVHPNNAQPSSSPPLMSIAIPISHTEVPGPTQQPQAVHPPPIPQRDGASSQSGGDERFSNSQTSVREISLEATIEQKGSKRSVREERNVEENQRRQGEQSLVNVAGEELTVQTPDNALLLDIVQSLPPMPSPPPQPQVHNGIATRSLGSVLLEGHLVPESRLEVAHNIQRMLRGVDMNYQLGEILLMFKLLTPDQLLAASLVSYGLITTTQISALGRIRQELHSIGLEYDLENLLILFRILTSEQLREVKSHWA